MLDRAIHRPWSFWGDNYPSSLCNYPYVKNRKWDLQLSFLMQKRAPALLDNIAQAFVMAPFFVLLEVNNFKCLILVIYLLIYFPYWWVKYYLLLQALQLVCGYEPYPGFHSRVQAKVEGEIKEWREKNQKLMPSVQWLLPYIYMEKDDIKI